MGISQYFHFKLWFSFRINFIIFSFLIILQARLDWMTCGPRFRLCVLGVARGLTDLIQEASSMTIIQSSICLSSSSNIKCSFCIYEECEQQHNYFISHVKKLTDILRKCLIILTSKDQRRIDSLWSVGHWKNIFPNHFL